MIGQKCWPQHIETSSVIVQTISIKKHPWSINHGHLFATENDGYFSLLFSIFQLADQWKNCFHVMQYSIMGASRWWWFLHPRGIEPRKHWCIYDNLSMLVLMVHRRSPSHDRLNQKQTTNRNTQLVVLNDEHSWWTHIKNQYLPHRTIIDHD